MHPAEKIALLGVNIDHVATLRQLRGTPYPDLMEAARAAIAGGAGQITVHLREDRRHIQDADVVRLKKELPAGVSLNLEMATSGPINKLALKLKPEWVCLVPERRQEVTTEGGLDLKKSASKLRKLVPQLKKAGILVSLFVEPTIAAVKASQELGADAVELHTGRYCLATQGGLGKKSGEQAKKELARIQQAGALAAEIGLRVHAGHGFDAANVRAVAQLLREDGSPLIEEFNIGHYLVCRAVQVGMTRAVREMLSAISAP
jgi:pyridoxine 5-phosphate synthase